MPPRRPQPTARDAVIALARRVRRAEAETVEDWEERAAVREFDGGQPRHTAEVDALEDLKRLHEPQRRLM